MTASMNPGGKYRPYLSYLPLALPQRRWPDQQIVKAPIWCSVDLRDGNQALIDPMDIPRKMRMFEVIKSIGFKEIEVGFPSASQIEFDFMRILIEQNLIPDDVVPQVLTQARSHLIRKTFQSLAGARQAIVHVYNSTSELQRRVVFQKDRRGIKQMAVDAVAEIKALAAETDTAVTLEYSPESFTGTEIEYALEVCEAVVDVWQPTPDQKLILNLPATVEMSTPNIYADMIEWFCRGLRRRDCVLISLHTHNDRGTGVAATELGLMAGADRVEGTLFGNGERTGNVDIVTVALNMYSQGIDPQLDFSRLHEIRAIAEECTRLPVHQRHPYAGDLVFTAFSGSHQDAISKGLHARQRTKAQLWEVPYLPIDPADIGQTYSVVRVNSQSGKGGVAHILDVDFKYRLPKSMQPEFHSIIQTISEQTGREVGRDTIRHKFYEEYIEKATPIQFRRFTMSALGGDQVECELGIDFYNEQHDLRGTGSGPIAACRDALLKLDRIPRFEIASYHEHSVPTEVEHLAMAYIQVELPGQGNRFGAGIDRNATKAAIRALLSALNRAFEVRTYDAHEFVEALKNEFNVDLPKYLRADFAHFVQSSDDFPKTRITGKALYEAFCQEYVNRAGRLKYRAFTATVESGDGATVCQLQLDWNGEPRTLSGRGQDSVAACSDALTKLGDLQLEIVEQEGATLGKDSDATAMAFEVVRVNGCLAWGAGTDPNSEKASVRAVFSAVNRAFAQMNQPQKDFVGAIRRRGFELPEEMLTEFHALTRHLANSPRGTGSPQEIYAIFEREYLTPRGKYELVDFCTKEVDGRTNLDLEIRIDGQPQRLQGSGNGPIDACKDALKRVTAPFTLRDFRQSGLQEPGGTTSTVAYVSVVRGFTRFGVGVDENATRASIKAILSALNRSESKKSFTEQESIRAMQTEFGYELPNEIYPEFMECLHGLATRPEERVPANAIWDRFARAFLLVDRPYRFLNFVSSSLEDDAESERCSFEVEYRGERKRLTGVGTGPVDACRDALLNGGAPRFTITHFEQHALTPGAAAEAVCYLRIELEGEAGAFFGVGVGANTTRASIQALLVALNRAAARTKPGTIAGGPAAGQKENNQQPHEGGV